MRTVFTPEMNELLIALYPCISNREIAEIFGCSVRLIENHGTKRLGLRKTLECKRSTPNATMWTAEMISWLKDNFYAKSNQQLADHLGTRLTVLRNKTRELGLKRVEVDNWTADQIAYLVANYKTMGDVEIKENLQLLYPRKFPWTRGHIHKKLTLLKLKRSSKERDDIVAKHVQPGGRSFTILKNSSSINLHDRYVANTIAWRNKPLADELIKYPDVIEIQRQKLKLNRILKEMKDA
jgi:hypothetical protein